LNPETSNAQRRLIVKIGLRRDQVRVKAAAEAAKAATPKAPPPTEADFDKLMKDFGLDDDGSRFKKNKANATVAGGGGGGGSKKKKGKGKGGGK
jgi:hypothetical protein